MGYSASRFGWLALLMVVGCHDTSQFAAPDVGIQDQTVDNAVIDAQVVADSADAAADVATHDTAVADTTAADTTAADAAADTATDTGAEDQGPALDQAWTYTWKEGTWGDCSEPCDGGQRSHDVWCERNDGVKAADTDCAGNKPDAMEACNTGPCHWWEAGGCKSPDSHCPNSSEPHFLQWDCCSATSGCGISPSDCIDTIGGHAGTCWPDNSCDGWNPGDTYP